MTGNPNIVEKIIIVGAKLVQRCTNSDLFKTSYDNISHVTISGFCSYFLYKNCKIDNQILIRLANLLFCVTEIPLSIKYHFYSGMKDYWDIKLMDYITLCTDEATEITNQDQYDRIEKRVHSLKNTMDKLMEKACDKKNIIFEIENSIKMIPTCCVKIIYEYQWTKSLIEYIDLINKYESKYV